MTTGFIYTSEKIARLEAAMAQLKLILEMLDADEPTPAPAEEQPERIEDLLDRGLQ